MFYILLISCDQAGSSHLASRSAVAPGREIGDEIAFKLACSLPIENSLRFGGNRRLSETRHPTSCGRRAAHYRMRYGVVSTEKSLEMQRTARISDEQAKMLADEFGVLVEVLKGQGTEEGEH